jgi:hypothetical protein
MDRSPRLGSCFSLTRRGEAATHLTPAISPQALAIGGRIHPVEYEDGEQEELSQ